MRKITAILCLVLLMVSAFGCGSKSAEEIHATVKLIDAQQNVLLDEACTLNKNGATAKDAVVNVCGAKKIAFQNNNGLFDGFMGISSTQEDGWLFYYNGSLAEKGLQETELDADGDNLIEMKYMNYNEAFGTNH